MAAATVQKKNVYKFTDRTGVKGPIAVKCLPCKSTGTLWTFIFPRKCNACAGKGSILTEYKFN